MSSAAPLRDIAVGELSAGYRYDFWRTEHTATGLGALGTLAFLPGDVQNGYGRRPASALVFLRVGLH